MIKFNLDKLKITIPRNFIF